MKAESYGFKSSVKSAEALFRRGEIAQALEVYQRVREENGSSISATTLNLLKRKELDCLQRLGRYEECLKAIAELRPFYEFEGDTRQLGWVLSLKAYCLKQLSRLKEGKQAAEEARELLRNTAHNLEYGVALNTLGNIYMGLGNLREAKKLLMYSIPAFERISPIPYGKVISSQNLLGQVCFMRGETKEALAHLNEALELCKDVDSKAQEAMVKGNLGIVHRRAAIDWPLASKMLKSSLKLSEELNDPLRIARKLTALCRLYILQRRWDKASEISELLERAQKLAQEGGYQRELATVWETRGWWEMALAQREGGSHLGAAEQALIQALQIGQRIAPQGDIVMEASERLGWVCLMRGSLEGALSYGERSLRIARHIGSVYDEGLAHRLLGAVYQTRAETKTERRKARDHLARSISLLEEAGARYDLGISLLYSGSLLVKDGDFRPEGERQLLEAGRVFEELKLSYWLGRCIAQRARGLILDNRLDKAREALERARSLLEEAGEGEALREVEEVEAQWEGASGQAIAQAREEQELLERLGQTSVEELGKLLQEVAQRVAAQRGLMGYRGSKRMVLGGHWGMKEGEARELLQELVDGEVLRPRQAVISTFGSEDARFPFLRGRGITSLMFVPFGLNSKVEGLLYLDRRSGGPFRQREMDFFVRAAGMLQFKVVEFQRDELLRENLLLKERLEEEYGFGNIVTVNPKLKQALRTAQRFKDSGLHILLQGETGTGKELLARAIHYSSERRGKKFVPVNCAAFTDTLLESEFFGHKRGSFTNALQDKRGLFEEADGGTLFLDEVTNASEELQAKLLRAIEEMEVRKVGETRSKKVDVRIIGATNRDLGEMVEAGKFRKDLYYRLKGVEIELPPLRERKEDIPPLINHFLNLSAQKGGGRIKGVTQEAMELLVAYDWPGNVRELKNEVERAAVLAEGGWITPEHLSKEVRAGNPRSSEEIFSFTLEESPKEVMERLERQLTESILRRCNGNKTKAAKLLGLTREGLFKRLRRYQAPQV